MKISTISKKLLITALAAASIAGSCQLRAMNSASDASIEQKATECCSICCDSYNHSDRARLVTPCNHKLCLACANVSIGQGYQYVNPWGIASERTFQCPFCRKSISHTEFNKMKAKTIRANVSERDKPAKIGQLFHVKNYGTDNMSRFFLEECTEDPNYPVESSDKRTPLKKLHAACCVGNLTRIQAILQTADNQYEMISQRDELSKTALHYAVDDRVDHLNIVRLLLDIADQAGMLHNYLAIRSSFLGTALEAARLRNGHPFDLTAMIELLESYGI